MTGEKITKKEIVDVIYEDTGMSKSNIKFVFDAVFDTIKDALVKGYAVELRGFGTFEVKIRKARLNARNPRTGETVRGCAHGIVDFKPGKALKQEVWPLKEQQQPNLYIPEGISLSLPTLPKRTDENIQNQDASIAAFN
jgi:integration host factor subunit beta